MFDACWLTLSAALSLAGMAWLALAMDTHWEQVMRQPMPQAVALRWGLRFLGALGLLLSMLSCSMADRPSMAVLVWVMWLTASALAVAMLLTHRPMLLRVFCTPWRMSRPAHSTCLTESPSLHRRPP